MLGKGEINLSPNFKNLDHIMRKEILNYSLFSILSGFGPIIIYNIDKILINHFLDLNNTGVYTIAFYFGSLVFLPTRSLLKITGPLIADAFRENNMKKIQEIYYKSSLNQLIIGGLLFIGIWSNIDNILIILGDEYLESKWVIFFIGIANIIEMGTGANGSIISLSKYYRVILLFLTILITLVVILMSVFIPLWGIVGAAVAIAIAKLVNNLIRYVFLYRKYKFQPFNFRHIAIIGAFFMIYQLSDLITQQQVYWDILFRGSFIVIASIAFFWFIPLSEDAKNVLLKGSSYIKKIFK